LSARLRILPCLLISSLWCFIVCGAAAIALDVPPLTGRIVDAGHLLPPDVSASLTAELEAHEARTGNQVVLLTLPSLEGQPLEEFSHRVATTWKLGRKGTDNGVLLLVVPGDRKIRIEVGYGLEGVLTDAVTSRIIRHEIVPRFKAGDFPGGITAWLHAILGTIEGRYQPTERQSPAGAPSSDSLPSMFLIAVVVGALVGVILGGHRLGLGVAGGGALSFLMALSTGLLLALLASVAAVIGILALSAIFRGRHSPGGGFAGGWSEGGFGGGFSGGGSFSGGGGDFGGGGASGDW